MKIVLMYLLFIAVVLFVIISPKVMHYIQKSINKKLFGEDHPLNNPYEHIVFGLLLAHYVVFFMWVGYVVFKILDWLDLGALI